jgi:hypothetical protein
MRSYILAAFLLLAGSIMSVQAQPVSIRDVKKATVTLYKVAEIPVAPLEQAPGAQYIQGYQVLAKHELTKTEIDSLRPVLTDSANYIFSVSKSCPFMAQYAMRIDGKAGTVDIIISRESCIKMIIKSDAEENPRYYDLRKQNKILPMVEEMIK